MNQATREIASLLNVSLEDAVKVQDRIDKDWLLDWSECTQRQFVAVVKAVAKVVL